MAHVVAATVLAAPIGPLAVDGALLALELALGAVDRGAGSDLFDDGVGMAHVVAPAQEAVLGTVALKKGALGTPVGAFGALDGLPGAANGSL